MRGAFNVRTAYFKPVLDLEATGRKIKTLIELRGISVRELQALMGFPYVQTIYNWFTGKNMPTIDNLIVLAQLLGTSIDELLVTRQVEVSIEKQEGSRESLIA